MRLADIFCDNMVLQRDQPICVYGIGAMTAGYKKLSLITSDGQILHTVDDNAATIYVSENTCSMVKECTKSSESKYNIPQKTALLQERGCFSMLFPSGASCHDFILTIH